MSRPGAGSRRELTLAMVLSVAAGGLALSSGGQVWADVDVVRQAPLPPYTDVLTGSELAPLVPATGLLLLAAALALVAVRGWGRVVVGLLVAVSGVVVLVAGSRALIGSDQVTTADLGSSVVGLAQARIEVSVGAGWPIVAVVAGLLGVAAGALVTLRGRSWPGLGRRYERESGQGEPVRRRPSRPESAEDRHQAAWKALDHGHDPTDDGPGDDRAGGFR